MTQFISFFNTHPFHVSVGSLRTITNVILATQLTHFYSQSTWGLGGKIQDIKLVAYYNYLKKKKN